MTTFKIYITTFYVIIASEFALSKKLYDRGVIIEITFLATDITVKGNKTNLFFRTIIGNNQTTAITASIKKQFLIL